LPDPTDPISDAPPASPPLWRQLQLTAAALASIRGGVSGSVAFEAVEPALRPGVQALGFQVLLDDKHYFPPYEAVPLVREDSLRRWPAIQSAMDRLAGKVSAEEVQEMNDAVDSKHRDVGDVVREFRAKKGL